MTDSVEPPPVRVRVTAPSRAEEFANRSGAGGAGSDPDALYIRTLIRSQLRLAIVCAAAFVTVLVGVPLLFALVPHLDEARVGPVPVSWLVLGAGFFPVLIAVAALYVRAASRNEMRYGSLADDEA